LAAHVLGYVKDSDELPPNVEDIAEVRSESMQKLRQTGKTGAAGVELSFNHELKGLSGWELGRRPRQADTDPPEQRTGPRQRHPALAGPPHPADGGSALAEIKDSLESPARRGRHA
jgi:hypothetical protein